jgi:hypothetical protein
VDDGFPGLAAQTVGAAEQVDRIGRELVAATQTLGDQQGLAGAVDRLIKASENVADAANPVLDLAQRAAIVQSFGQGARLLEILQIRFVMGAVLRDAGQLQGGLDLGGSECARSSASWKRARASVGA